MNKFRLHTPEELQQIAEHDFDRFKDISKYYYENDFEYFETAILPIIEKHKNKQLIVSGLNQSEHIDNDKIEIKVKDKINHSDSIEYSDNNDPNNFQVKTKKKNNLLFYALTAFTLLIITVLLYYFLIYNNSTKQAERLLKDKKFDLALQKLNEIDSTSEKYQEIKSILYYAKGGFAFEVQNYKDAYTFLNRVDNSNEFYPDAKSYLDKINTDQNIIYQKGMNHIEAKEYGEAQNEFQKIKPSDGYYNKAQSKINFIKGTVEYNMGNYGNANDFFKTIDKTDEYYKIILTMQPAIDNFLNNQKDKETNRLYTQFLIRISDRIQDEYQLMTQNDTWLYIKNTYLKNIMDLRSELNSYSYDSRSKDKNLIDFKKLILSWANSYIKYGEDIGHYGYYSDYNGDRMWSNYGYELHKDKDDGNDLHQKVIKKYKEEQVQYALN